MSIGGQKIFIPKPPDKGSFPLDHDGECKAFMMKYLRCIRDDAEASNCRHLAKDYLQCRMDNNLMAKEDWNDLGFSEPKTTTWGTIV